MKIILKEDIVNLGFKNDVVEVKNGYAEEAAKAFEGVSLTIPVKVSPTGTIYGSVGAAQVHEALLAAGHNVDRKIVSVHESIKTPGKYTGIVRLHKEVAVEIPFEVIAENAEELAAERAARKAEEAAHQAALAAAKAAEEGAEEGAEEVADEAAERGTATEYGVAHRRDAAEAEEAPAAE